LLEISGPWIKGHAFDIHTIKSEYLGENKYGHPLYETIRSTMGQYLYELKFKQEFPIIEKIIKLLSENEEFVSFVSGCDVILPVPPSNKYRRIQPVVLIAQEIARLFKKELRQDVIISSNLEELKNIDINEKQEIIEKSINIEGQLEKSKKILVFDDVFDSGSTLVAISNALKVKGYIDISIFTLTKTRIPN